MTSHIKTMNDNDAEHVTPKLYEEYNNYKQFVEFPAKIKSMNICFSVTKCFTMFIFRLRVEKQT